MPIVAPNTYRLSAVGTIGGRSVVNVFHVQKLGSTPPAVQEAASILVDAYVANFLPNVDAELTMQAVDYVDLSSTGGDSGRQGWSTDTNGALSGTACPPQVSALLHWQAAGSRAQRNGRTYLAGLPSAQVFETGLLASAWVTQLTDAGEAFISDLQDADLSLSVLSVTGDTGQPRAIGACVCDPRVGTQRRRNRG